MSEIKLNLGKVALVDDEDLDRILTQYNKWMAINTSNDCWYAYTARRAGPRIEGKKINFIMHREILGLTPGDGKLVDHINGNGLDNRRANLRIATTHQNAQNTRRALGGAGVRGVTWDRDRQKWMAQIKAGGRKYHLGRFDEKIAAALAYNEAARRYHGEFAVLNEIQQ